MPSNAIAVMTVLTGTASGALVDLRTRRMPNALSGGLAVAGLALAASGLSGVSLGSSLAGLAIGLALMMPGHLFGGTGAGDVKLFAGAGAVVGVARVVPAFLYAALAGGVIALCVALHRRRLRQSLAATATFIATSAGNAADIKHPNANNRFAYAPAIAIGALLAALGM